MKSRKPVWMIGNLRLLVKEFKAPHVGRFSLGTSLLFFNRFNKKSSSFEFIVSSCSEISSDLTLNLSGTIMHLFGEKILFVGKVRKYCQCLLD